MTEAVFVPSVISKSREWKSYWSKFVII